MLAPPQELEQPHFSAMAALSNPDLHEDAIGELNFSRALCARPAARQPELFLRVSAPGAVAQTKADGCRRCARFFDEGRSQPGGRSLPRMPRA